MSRWYLTFTALMVCAMACLVGGKDMSPFIAAALIAFAFADEEREYEGGDDDAFS